MTDKYNLVAFLAVLAAIVLLCALGALWTGSDRNVIGTAIVGLIGVIGTFRPRGQASAAAAPAGQDAVP